MEISNRENNACLFYKILYICVNSGIKYAGLCDDNAIVSYHHDICNWSTILNICIH